MEDDRRASITVFSDYVCPFCYLEEPDLARVRKEYKDAVEVNWRANELRPDPIPTLDPNGEYLNRVWNASVYPMARSLGMKLLLLPLVQPRSRKALEAAEYAREEGKFDEMHTAVFRAFFEDGEDIGREGVLLEIGASVGLDREVLRAALEEGLYTEKVLAGEGLARKLGVNSVPTMLVGPAGEPLEKAEAINRRPALRGTRGGGRRASPLTPLYKAGELASRRLGRKVDPYAPPPNDPQTYRLIRTGRNAGMFQLVSPGQMHLSRRLKPRRMSDLISQISLFRPGPVRGDLVTPYVKRRNGLEPYSVPLEELEEVLRPTYGVLVFQEQVLAVSNAVAGFTLTEGDLLRRAMTKDRGLGAMRDLRREFLRRARTRGVPAAVADEVFSWMEGFSVYDFSAAHAASFAEHSYASAYMRIHHPAEFFAAVLNSQPMGFYSPRTLVNEARRIGLSVLPPDVHLPASPRPPPPGAAGARRRPERGDALPTPQNVGEDRRAPGVTPEAADQERASGVLPARRGRSRPLAGDHLPPRLRQVRGPAPP